MNEIELALQRHYQRRDQGLMKSENRISKGFTKILCSIIVVLSCTIYMKLSPQNQENFKKVVFESNLAFTKMNDWYTKVFGHILPSVSEPKDLMASQEFRGERTSYLDGYAISVNPGEAILTLAGGLFVFEGEKEGYGHTYIVQGADGVDIWYGGIQDTDFSLYDYVDEGSVLGMSEKDHYYVVFQKDGQFLSYEDYIQKVSA